VEAFWIDAVDQLFDDAELGGGCVYEVCVAHDNPYMRYVISGDPLEIFVVLHSKEYKVERK